ncbi:sperm acrosome-associated protein 9-like [Symsagittifera roscoffensis]|uniref:sperm acrosome-associated protein 9-like n=1 Tax=Symsagittifera roscoffensis TaxID=84072 RepID=UPI00307B2429
MGSGRPGGGIGSGMGGGNCGSGPTMATRRGQNANIIPLKNHSMYIQLSGDDDIESLKRDYYKLSNDYETFAQQQYAFAQALEEARQTQMQCGSRSGTAEITNMEAVEQYVLDKDAKHAVNLRVARQFICLHGQFEDYYFKMQDYFDRTFTAAVRKNLDTSIAQSLLSRIRDFLGKRFNFFELRVDYPYQQVYRLGVEEARKHFGGAVSYLPIALEIMSCARKELARLTKILEQGIDEEPPVVKTVPKESRPGTDFIARNKKFVDTADLTEKLRILNGKYCARCALPRRGKGGDCFPFEPQRPWKGAGRHSWNYAATKYCACSDSCHDNSSSFCGRLCH